MDFSKNSPMKSLLLVGWSVWFLFLPACTDRELEIIDTLDVPEVDDQLEIQGEVCTDPSLDANFPVKIMFIMDCSGSMQQTDEGLERVEAVRQVVRRYANNSNVLFNIIKFNAQVADLTQGFRPLSGDEPEVFGPQGIMEADSMTDYQGALGVAYQNLLQDMLATANGSGGLPELTRTKYVVIFFSDGTPDPVCYGCVTDPPSHPRYLPRCTGPHNPNQMCCDEDLHVVCTLMDDFVLDISEKTEEDFVGLGDGGTDYNHNYQLFQLIEEIMELKKLFHVGEMRFHSAFLYCRDQDGNPTTPLCEAAEEAYNLDPDRGRALLREMSNRGNGTFRDFTSGQGINFLKIDFTAIRRHYTLKNLLAVNVNALPALQNFSVDSDGDGLDDELELENGTDILLSDSDGDGYRDLLEQRMISSGFDPLDPGKPAEPCLEPYDSDGDGLLSCEEHIYGTDDKLADSDSDGFPDRIEIVFGTDPLRDDGDEDLDSDGRRNSDELLFHSHPGRNDPVLWQDRRYWYELEKIEQDDSQGPSVDGDDRQCFRFNIRHISLVTTADRNGPGSQGFNDVLIWFNQSSYDDPFDPGHYKVACVRAQYIAPDYKVPGDLITLTDADFVHPTSLDLGFSASSCVSTNQAENP